MLILTQKCFQPPGFNSQMREPSEILTPSSWFRISPIRVICCAVNSARQARNVAGLNCKQQFEIFAAVKRELQWIERAPPT